jgi:hypothetical protein
MGTVPFGLSRGCGVIAEPTVVTIVSGGARVGQSECFRWAGRSFRVGRAAVRLSGGAGRGPGRRKKPGVRGMRW